MKWLRSVRSSTLARLTGSVELGQPVPELNFVSELNSSARHAGAVGLRVDVLARERPLGVSLPQHPVLLASARTPPGGKLALDEVGRALLGWLPARAQSPGRQRPPPPDAVGWLAAAASQ